MSTVKEAWIKALEESADRLEKVVGNHELPNLHDAEGIRRVISDGNFVAKWKLVDLVTILRSRAEGLQRGDVAQGDWPPFWPDEAHRAMEGIEQVREMMAVDSRNEILRVAIMRALKPQRDVIETYAICRDGIWKFRDEDCDPVADTEIPPAPFT
jgi:hypothetical protein